MKFLHNLLKGVSFTGALFVFQACYGTPQDPLYNQYGTAPMTFSLRSHTTGQPLEGIHISGKAYGSENFLPLGITGADGRCQVEIPYSRNYEGPFIRFEDTEGQFAAKDTTLADLRERDIIIKLDALQ